MKQIKHNIVKIKNPETGEWEGLPALVGESAYELAVRLGTFTGTEEEYNNFTNDQRDVALEAIEEKGEQTLASIPSDYTALAQEVDANTTELEDARIGYDGTVYSDVGDAVRGQIRNVNRKLSVVVRPTSNLLDLSSITEGVYISPDGSVANNPSLFTTGVISVSEGDIVYGWGNNGSGYVSITFQTLCAYDSDNVAIPSSGIYSETTPPYTVPSGVDHIRISAKIDYLSYTDLYIGYHNVGVDYEDNGVNPIYVKMPEYIVQDGESILESLIYCYNKGIKKIIVESGTYDVISEYETLYGSNYFVDYVNYNTSNPFDRGLWLEDIEIVFSPGSKVICKYTGNNENVSLYFSAFATGNNVIIDGLNLDSENLRYGIHADYNSGSSQTYFCVKNSDLRHYKNATSNQAIGAGLGRHVLWIFENNIFRSDVEHICMRIHNNVNSDAQSKIVVKDCYIDGDGYFQFNSYSTSELPTTIEVCGCSYKTAPVVGKETSDSYDNFTMIAWNNEARTNEIV